MLLCAEPILETEQQKDDSRKKKIKAGSFLPLETNNDFI